MSEAAIMSGAVKNKRKAAAEDYVKVDKFKWSDLWKKEDWLAVWIGFIIIAIAAIVRL